MTRKQPADGTYYFLEFTGVQPPYVLRRVVSDGVRRDEAWSGRRRDWVPTNKLFPYDYNRGENDLITITEEQLPEYIEKVNTTADANAARNSRPFYFVRGDGTQDTDEFVMYRYGTDPDNLSQVLRVSRSTGGAIMSGGSIPPQVWAIGRRIWTEFAATGSLPESGVEPDPAAPSLGLP